MNNVASGITNSPTDNFLNGKTAINKDVMDNGTQTDDADWKSREISVDLAGGVTVTKEVLCGKTHVKIDTKNNLKSEVIVKNEIVKGKMTVKEKILMLGKPVIDEIKQDTLTILGKMQKRRMRKLVLIKFSSDVGAVSYANSIIKNCYEIGVNTDLITLDPKMSTTEFSKFLLNLNTDNEVSAIMPLQPIPPIFNDILIQDIYKTKDIDCMTYKNMPNFLLSKDNNDYLPCTAEAIMRILKHYKVELCGKNVVVIGRSLTVGKPISMMLLNADATVTMCHSKTNNLKEISSKADIVIVAVGKAKAFNADYFGDEAIVIDVGINYDDNGKLCGDVDFDSVWKKVKGCTPVPKGLGGITSALLIQHIAKSTRF